MSEFISHEVEPLPRKESKFGNTEKILQIMREGEVVLLGNIEEVVGGIHSHANEVNIASLPSCHVNDVLGARVQKGNDSILCVFKPYKGESSETKKKTQVNCFYSRECAAYMVSEHFDFDVVPPTLIREVNGEVGSLQLFLDHDYYLNFSNLPGEKIDEAELSSDWHTIAILDWILANCERHWDNMMVDVENPSSIAAIDHGIIFSSYNYYEMALRGPSLQLTHDNKTDRPKVIDIPEDILILVEEGLKNRQILDEKLRALTDISEESIEQFWSRVQDVIDYKKFLSKMNYKQVTGISWLGSMRRKKDE